MTCNSVTLLPIEQDAVISQFNESDMRAATNVVQHRLFANWMVSKEHAGSFTYWYGRTSERETSKMWRKLLDYQQASGSFLESAPA